MNSSTLPPLLGNYLPEYEQKHAVSLTSINCRSDEAGPISEQLEQVKNGSNEVEKKPKHIRTMAHKRHVEAEEKASKEKEEKALHTLKMWNVVKENERKRKQRMLKDRVNLQHQMIKKQDELIQEKHEEQKTEKQKQNSQARTQKQKLGELPQKVQQKNKQPSKTTNNNKPRKRKPVILEAQNEQAPEKTCDEEKKSEASQKLDTFSEEDLSEFLEKSIMEDADFHELRYQPLQIQLERLFGDEADGYLNPTVKESPRKVFDLAVARKKGQHGAAALWEALRTYSRQKLVNKDALILPDVKNAYACFVRECLRRHITPVKRNFVSEEETPVNVNPEESDILKDVKYRRHRQELMYRIAHINKDKTRLLFQVIGPPHYSEVQDEEGIRRYYPEITHEENEEKPPLVKLPDIHDNSTSSNTLTMGNTLSVRTTDKGHHLEAQPRENRSKLVFLTEKKATCRGEFAKRLTKDDKEDSNLKQSKSVDILQGSKTPSPIFSQRLWEPLSMQALLDHQVTVLERRTEMAGFDSSQVWNVCM